MRRFAEAQGFVAHRCLVLDFGVGKGQDPVRALLWSLLGLSPFPRPEKRRRARGTSGRRGNRRAEALVFLNDLLDLPQIGEWRALYDAMDNATRNRGKLALTAALAGYACRDRPILLIVEDLHWADPTGPRPSCCVCFGNSRWPRIVGYDVARRRGPARRRLARRLPGNAIRDHRSRPAADG